MDERMNWHGLTYEEHPVEMWQLLDDGLTMGVFQIEKGYARQLCKKMRPRSIDHLGLIVALNRPGPIRAGVPESLIRRMHGEEEVTYDHPILEPITKATYGHLVYQEHIMRFFSALGYSESDADEMRKILGKKKPEVMATVRYGEGEWQGKGYTMMAEAAGIDSGTADRLWAKIEGFASYSFNKSHAIAYATMAFRTVYAKWKGAAKFTIACIQTNPEDAGDYVSEGRRRHIQVRPPSMRLSDVDIRDIDGDIYFGFANIKGIGKGAAQYVVYLRDTYGNMGPDEFREALAREQRIWADDRPDKRSPGQTFGQNKIDLLLDAGAFDDYIVRDLPLAERQAKEKELLQVILSDNCEEVFQLHHEEVEGCDTYLDLDNDEVKRVDIPGVVASVSEKRTKKTNEAMGIVTVEYQGDEAEFVIFPQEWKSHRSLWKERTPGIFSLRKTDRGIAFHQGLMLS